MAKSPKAVKTTWIILLVVLVVGALVGMMLINQSTENRSDARMFNTQGNG